MTAIPSVTQASDWYAGFSAGEARHEATVGDLLGTTFYTGSVDGNDQGWNAFAGMALWDKYLAAELGYVDLGKATAKSGATSAEGRDKGYTAALAGLIPFTDRFGLLLKFGLIRSHSYVTTSGPGVPPTQDATDLNPFGGIGVQYDFSKSFGARIELERYNAGSLGSSYINLISGGIVYRFGK